MFNKDSKLDKLNKRIEELNRALFHCEKERNDLSRAHRDCEKEKSDLSRALLECEKERNDIKEIYEAYKKRASSIMKEQKKRIEELQRRCEKYQLHKTTNESSKKEIHKSNRDCRSSRCRSRSVGRTLISGKHSKSNIDQKSESNEKTKHNQFSKIIKEKNGFTSFTSFESKIIPYISSNLNQFHILDQHKTPMKIINSEAPFFPLPKIISPIAATPIKKLDKKEFNKIKSSNATLLSISENHPLAETKINESNHSNVSISKCPNTEQGMIISPVAATLSEKLDKKKINKIKSTNSTFHSFSEKHHSVETKTNECTYNNISITECRDTEQSMIISPSAVASIDKQDKKEFDKIKRTNSAILSFSENHHSFETKTVECNYSNVSITECLDTEQGIFNRKGRKRPILFKSNVSIS